MKQQGHGAPILVVDDAAEDLLLMQRVLRECKLLNPVISCPSGDDCIGVLQDAVQRGEFPVLMLLDLIMAPTSGLDILRAMNMQGCIREIPVVMLSGIRDIRAVREGYQLGAQTFLIKPVAAEDILRLVNSVPRISVEDSAGGYLLRPAFETSPSERSTDTSFFRKKGVATFSA